MTRRKFMKNRKFLNAFLIKDIEVQWREVHQSLKEIMVNEVAPGKEIQRSFVVFWLNSWENHCKVYAKM